jgi:hypothetical protein
MRKFPKRRKKSLLPDLPVALTGRAWIYPPLVIAALIFAQALKMPLSYMIFIFVLITPLGAAFQLILGALYIRTSARAESDSIEKRTPVSFSVITSNECIFPFPFIEAELLVPDERGAKCISKRVGFSLAPFSGCEIKRTAEFAFRGVYSVGLKQLWLYDSFRIVKMRLKRENYADIFVLPRRYELPPKDLSSESDRNTQNVTRLRGSDNTESSDIRSYIKGDSLKSIHWKLTSKSQDLIVKDFSKNTGNSVYIFCDLEPHYSRMEPDSIKQVLRPQPEYTNIIDNLNSDLVVEHCLAAALRELRIFNNVTLLWLEAGENGNIRPKTYKISCIAEYEAAFRELAAAPLVYCAKHPTMLSNLVSDDDSPTFIFVTAFLDSASTSEYISIATARRTPGMQAAELIYCSDSTLYVKDAETERIIREHIALLSAHMEVSTN